MSKSAVVNKAMLLVVAILNICDFKVADTTTG
jgi:hypothetical protein